MTYFVKFFLLSLVIIFVVGFSFAQKNTSSRQPETSWELKLVFDGKDTPSGKFQDAVAIDVDSEGNLFIVDRARHRVVKFSSSGQFEREIGGFGRGPEQFSDPVDVDAHLTLNIFVADYNNNRIVRFDSNLNYLSEFTNNLDPFYYYEMPLSVAVSGQYDIFLLEDLNKRIVRFNRFNEPQFAFGDATNNLGQLLGPQKISVSEQGEVYVSDPAQKSVLVFDYLGNYLLEISHPDFQKPNGIDINKTGQLLITDSKRQKLYLFKNSRKFSKSIDLKQYKINPVDAVFRNIKVKEKQNLYVLTSNKCYIFEG